VMIMMSLLLPFYRRYTIRGSSETQMHSLLLLVCPLLVYAAPFNS
jgi:hypothetical protein